MSIQLMPFFFGNLDCTMLFVSQVMLVVCQEELRFWDESVAFCFCLGYTPLYFVHALL